MAALEASLAAVKGDSGDDGKAEPKKKRSAPRKKAAAKS
jgi:hypothetical protein